MLKKKALFIMLLVISLSSCAKENNYNTEASENITATSIVTVTPAISPEIKQNIPTVTPALSPEIKQDIPTAAPALSPEIEQISTEDFTTPILIKNIFVGGIVKGKWMQYDDFYNSNVVDFEGFEYDVYSNKVNIGTAVGRKPSDWMTGETIQGDKYEEKYCIVELYDKDNQPVSYDIALKAEWDVFPQPYIEDSSEQEKYIDSIKDYIAEYGVDNPVTSIKQIVRVDLEGDGVEERLIAADNTIEDQFETVKKGDNAILVFQKDINGKSEDQIVEQDIRLEDDEYLSLYRLLFRVETIADLDGDKVMEVVVRSWYYEGEAWSIYKLMNNKLELVAVNGLGA